MTIDTPPTTAEERPAIRMLRAQSLSLAMELGSIENEIADATQWLQRITSRRDRIVKDLSDVDAMIEESMR